MSKCKWDREAEDYLRDGKPCRWDDYGDPTKHCTARRSCANHIGQFELTCARCIGRTRVNIGRIADLAPLMLPLAMDAGVNSEAANLAGPAADYATFSARRLIDKRWITDHIPVSQQQRAIENLIPDDDEWHPYAVLTRWEAMLREDYGNPRPVIGCTTIDQLADVAACRTAHGPACWATGQRPTSVTSAADYLTRVLHRVAQDDEQDFPLLAREMRKCRDHLEAVLRNSSTPERGAPCPICAETGKAPRLTREYGHWCEDYDCENFHFSTLLDHETGEDVPDTHGDEWVCPRNKAHRWSHEDYRRWVDDWADDAKTERVEA